MHEPLDISQFSKVAPSTDFHFTDMTFFTWLLPQLSFFLFQKLNGNSFFLKLPCRPLFTPPQLQPFTVFLHSFSSHPFVTNLQHLHPQHLFSNSTPTRTAPCNLRLTTVKLLICKLSYRSCSSSLQQYKPRYSQMLERGPNMD